MICDGRMNEHTVECMVSTRNQCPRNLFCSTIETESSNQATDLQQSTNMANMLSQCQRFYSPVCSLFPYAPIYSTVCLQHWKIRRKKDFFLNFHFLPIISTFLRSIFKPKKVSIYKKKIAQNSALPFSTFIPHLIPFTYVHHKCLEFR